MFSSSQNSQEAHQRICYQSKQQTNYAISHSEAMCGSVLLGNSGHSSRKFPLHDTDNHFHSNELCGIPKTVPVAHETNQNLRLFEEIRIGPVSECLVREKAIFQAPPCSALGLFHKLRIPRGIIRVSPTLVNPDLGSLQNPNVMSRVKQDVYETIHYKMITPNRNDMFLAPDATSVVDPLRLSLQPCMTE